MAKPGTVMNDPNHWQPLALAQQIAQNGLPIPGQIQSFIGPHWGHVNGFALPASETGTPDRPGTAAAARRPGDRRRVQAVRAVDVIRYSSELDPTDGVTVDISPAAQGDNSLGTNDGNGHEVNPATGQPYEPHVVLRADFARVLAEFWADGPKSETPPGHWNVVANAVVRRARLQATCASAARAQPVDRLEWDMKLYFALNGAVHDAAIAAWGLKGYYDSARPISMIRYMGGKGQSSDPSGPSYDPEGLPLVPGLVEVVTAASSAPGQRHEALGDHVGEIAVQSWLGNPEDPETADERRRLDPRRRLGALPAHDVRDAGVRRLSSRATARSAARRRRCMTAFTGERVLPGRPRPSGRPRRVTLIHEEGPTEDVDPPVGDLLRRRRPGRHLAALRGHPRPGRRPRGPQDRGRSAAWTPGPRRRPTSTGPPSSSTRRMRSGESPPSQRASRARRPRRCAR